MATANSPTLPVPLTSENCSEPVPGSVVHRLAREVTLLVQDDTARLLDLEHGRFYALDWVGTRLLTNTLQSGPTQAVRCVSEEYGVDDERVRTDLVRLLTRLRKQHLIVTAETAGRRLLPGRVGLWLLLALAWLSLRTLGLARTIRLWRGKHRRAAVPWVDTMTSLVERLDQAIRAAASTHPLSPQCKERAVVAWHILCNRWGLPADLVVGVLAFPFQAHAWVECGPLVVTDERLRCEMHTPAARYR
jgi:transglutaminase superfamily protein/coenzyme PQQ synthesis protein D (PqqD)